MNNNPNIPGSQKKGDRNVVLLVLLVITIIALMIVLGLIVNVSSSTKRIETTSPGNDRKKPISNVYANRLQTVQPGSAIEPGRRENKFEGKTIDTTFYFFRGQV